MPWGNAPPDTHKNREGNIKFKIMTLNWTVLKNELSGHTGKNSIGSCIVFTGPLKESKI